MVKLKILKDPLFYADRYVAIFHFSDRRTSTQTSRFLWLKPLLGLSEHFGCRLERNSCFPNQIEVMMVGGKRESEK